MRDPLADLPFDSGIYQLLLAVPQPLAVTVGALGPQHFAAGWYVYTGSMKRALGHRLRRHAALEKPLRWHIDYLTSHTGVAAWRAWPWVAADPQQECRRHQELAGSAGVRVPVRGFGSSDCRCAAHLVYLGPTRQAWDEAAPAAISG